MQLYLAQSRWLRFFAFAVLYVAQGIPIGLFTIALPAWLAELGAGAAEVGTLIAVTGLPWAFKLIAGPFMDRFAFPAMGRRRPWVMGAQLGLCLALGALLLVGDPVAELWTLIAVGFGINAFAAVQDVAVDGMAIDILPANERGRANALMAFGQVLGYSGFGALAGYLLSEFGLPTTALVAMLIVATIFAVATLARERGGERLLPWSEGVAVERAAAQIPSFRVIFRDLLRALLLPMSLLLIAVEFFSRMSSGVYVSLLPVLAVQDLGYSAEAYANMFGLTGGVAAFVGILFGPMIDRFGVQRLLTIALLGLAVLTLSFALSVGLWGQLGYVLSMLAVVQLFSQGFFVAMIAIFMGICWSRVSATQFAIYMSLANLSRSLGAALYAGLAAQLGAEGILYVMAFLYAAGAALLTRFDAERHEAELAALDEATDVPGAPQRA